MENVEIAYLSARKMNTAAIVENQTLVIEDDVYCWNEEIGKFTLCDTNPDLYSVATGEFYCRAPFLLGTQCVIFYRLCRCLIHLVLEHLIGVHLRQQPGHLGRLHQSKYAECHQLFHC